MARYDDPYRAEEFQYEFVVPLTSFRSTGGLSPISPASLGSNVFTALIAGQSNAASYGLSSYVPVHSNAIVQINLFDGAIYQAKEPLLGTTGRDASWAIEFADRLITARGYSSVVLVPLAIGATSVAEWAPLGKYGARIKAGLMRCKAIDISVNCVLWQQGESDTTTQTAVYRSAIEDIISSLAAEDLSVDWYIGKSTRTSDGTTSPTVRTAVDQLVSSSNRIFAGADTDQLGNEFRRPDGQPHFSNAGRAAAAAMWASAVLATI